MTFGNTKHNKFIKKVPFEVGKDTYTSYRTKIDIPTTTDAIQHKEGL